MMPDEFLKKITTEIANRVWVSAYFPSKQNIFF
jgi:hypothetical protein